jgi:hypothetical protein
MHARDFGSAAISGISGKMLVSLLRTVIPFLAALSSAYAEDVQRSRQVWLNPGFYSWHFDRSKDFREDNWGMGAEVVLAPDHALMAGTFINSDRARSRYAAYQWRPLHWQPYGVNISAGVMLGVTDGYPKYHNGGWFAALLPLLAVEGKRVGANFSIVPTIKDRVHGAVVVQIKLRVW